MHGIARRAEPHVSRVRTISCGGSHGNARVSRLIIDNMRALWLGLFLGLLVACGSSKPAAPEEPVCGNGIVEANESCDDGADNGVTGCTTSCTFACNDPVVDCPAVECQVATC